MSEQLAMDWTDERIELLRKFTDAGWSCGQIAKLLDTTRNAIIGKQHRIGIRSKIKPYNNRPKPSGPKPRHSKLHPDRQYKPIRKRKPPMILDNSQLREIEVVPLNLSLLDLKQGQCRFPYGDGPFFFCGHPVEGEHPYCLAHCCVAYTASSGERPHRGYWWRKQRPAKQTLQTIEPVDPDEMGTAA